MCGIVGIVSNKSVSASIIGALKKLNGKITETIVIASLIDDDNSNSIDEILDKIKQLEMESLDLAKKSDSSRPWL